MNRAAPTAQLRGAPYDFLTQQWNPNPVLIASSLQPGTGHRHRHTTNIPPSKHRQHHPPWQETATQPKLASTSNTTHPDNTIHPGNTTHPGRHGLAGSQVHLQCPPQPLTQLLHALVRSGTAHSRAAVHVAVRRRLALHAHAGQADLRGTGRIGGAYTYANPRMFKHCSGLKSTERVASRCATIRRPRRQCGGRTGGTGSLRPTSTHTCALTQPACTWVWVLPIAPLCRTSADWAGVLTRALPCSSCGPVLTRHHQHASRAPPHTEGPAHRQTRVRQIARGVHVLHKDRVG